MNKELFIQGYLDRISKKFDISKDIAFEVFSIATVVDKSFQFVFDNILIKGGKDGGIDGAMFVDNGNSYVLMLFQCKNSLSLRQNEIEKFRHDIDDLFMHGIEKPNSENLKPVVDEFRQLSSSGHYVDIKGYFLYHGENYDANHAGNREFFERYNKPGEFEVWDSDDLYGKINQLIKFQNKRKDTKFIFHPEPTNVVLSDRERQALYTYSVNNVKAANFRISALELCNLIDQEAKANGTYDFLFSENVRGFLGFRPRPNKRMRETLQNLAMAVYFPLLNNGITVICQKADLPTAPQDGKYILSAHNPVIVNGLQTSRVIYDVYLKAKERGENLLDNVFVNVRLYVTDDQAIVEMITDATNTQTPINYRDKISNKDFGAYAKIIFENNDIAYINKRGDVFSNELSRKLSDSIDSDTVLKYWYASFYEQPEIAKNSISKVLEEVYDAANNDHPLGRLFGGDKDSPIYLQLLHTYRIYRLVQDMRKTKNDEFIEHINELLAYGIYKQFEGDLNQTADKDKLIKAYDYSYKVINEIVVEELKMCKAEGRIFSYNGYFKKAVCRYDYNRKANIRDNENLLEALLLKR